MYQGTAGCGKGGYSETPGLRLEGVRSCTREWLRVYPESARNSYGCSRRSRRSRGRGVCGPGHHTNGPGALLWFMDLGGGPSSSAASGDAR